MDYEIISGSVERTIEIGSEIGSQLRGGEIIALTGPLGSGKTHLIKGIAAGAGAKDLRDVNSPTFVIVNEYAGRLDIYHIDAYRLNSVSEFEMLGFDDFLSAAADLLCGVSRIDDQLGVIDDPLIVIRAVIGADQYRIVAF